IPSRWRQYRVRRSERRRPRIPSPGAAFETCSADLVRSCRMWADCGYQAWLRPDRYTAARQFGYAAGWNSCQDPVSDYAGTVSAAGWIARRGRTGDGLLRHQADPVYAGTFGEVDHFRDFMELERFVPTHENHSGTAVLEERGKAGLQRRLIDGFGIQKDRVSGSHGDDDVMGRSGGTIVRLRGLRHQGVQTPPHRGRNDHENDNKDQQDIDHRRHVHFRLFPSGSAE